MKTIINWIKQNKLSAALLALIFFYLLLRSLPPFLLPKARVKRPAHFEASLARPGEIRRIIPPVPSPEYPPTPEAEKRLILKESNISLLVKDVASTQRKIIRKVKTLGGYMVRTTLSKPEGAASGSIVLRVPQQKVNEALDYFRGLAVKVVSENLYGRDVTDEYFDLEARLASLLKSKAKFEEILEKAEKVEEVLKVQKELVNLQEEIDRLKGRQNFLEKSAQMSKITVYLSTDELALPYTPAEPWRPKAVFKQAVRSLIRNSRRLATLFIWLGVYSPFWLPIVVVFWLLRWRKK